MYQDRWNLDSQKFTLKQLKNLKYMQKYLKDQIRYFINHSKQFQEYNQVYVVYVKEEKE